MEQALQSFIADAKELRKTLRAETVSQVSKRAIRDSAEKLGRRWFSEIVPSLGQVAVITPEIVKKYSDSCARLIKLSAPNNLRSSYLEVMDALTKRMRDEILLPLQATPTPGPSQSSFGEFVAALSDPDAGAYFQEAIDCAKNGFLRAAAVMAWCAAIDRMHRKIELVGFATFNVVSAQMASQQKGRFKKFNQTQNVSTLSEIREVFDTVVLWVSEGMGLIDSNQHTRLRSCFEMRCHCAHPGEAPITEYNLMSMFSDIQQIVLENPKFAL